MAAHEAGHALMAYLQGDQNVEIRVDRAGWLTASTPAPWIGAISTMRKRLKERYLLICVAGEAGEKVMLGRVYTPQASMVLQNLNNDAARFLIAWQGNHAIYGASSAPSHQVVGTVHGQFNQADFEAEWDAYIDCGSTEFSRPQVKAALKDLMTAALINTNTPTPVSATQILSIVQKYGL